MVELDRIEKLFGIKIVSTGKPYSWTYSPELSEQQVQQVISQHPDQLEWQDAENPSCGWPGSLFVYLKLRMEDLDELGREEVLSGQYKLEDCEGACFSFEAGGWFSIA